MLLDTNMMWFVVVLVLSVRSLTDVFAILSMFGFSIFTAAGVAPLFSINCNHIFRIWFLIIQFFPQ